ncbi:MAG: flagellar biosynthesis protein FlhF [Ignavibacteria bacterium]|nr:flagellar biosynthesis protein FlhF [Ignavibacteria bacterium]
MKVKKFVGPTLRSVTEQMKTEFGDNAIILNTRKVPHGGLFSFLGRDLLEITAGVEDDVLDVLDIGNQRSANPGSEKTFDYILSRFQSDTTNLDESTRKISGVPAAKNGNIEGEDVTEILSNLSKDVERKQRGNKIDFPTTSRSDLHNLKDELNDVKHTLREIVEQLKYSKMPSLPDHLRRAFVTLVGQDVNEQLAAQIVQSIYAHLSGEQLDDDTLVEQRLLSEMAKMIRTAGAIEQKLGRAKVVVFVGPTGVGKTTTIAKLAAINKLFNGLNVALISADTYRIAAIEQLRTFAAIANIEMDVVYRPGEMQKAIRKHKTKDVIIVDTFGRSQRETKGLTQLRKFLDVADPDEVHLVLSAASNEKTMIDICERFDVAKPNRLVFSKVDESATFGPLLNISYKTGIPISYITTGQTVPDDIVIADSLKIATMIFRGVIYDV